MITGKVIEFESGKPIKGAFVWYGYEPNEYVLTDSSGNFSINVAPFTVLEIAATGRKPLKDVVASSINGTIITLEKNTTQNNENCTLEDGDCSQTVYRKKPCVWCWIVGIAITAIIIHETTKDKPKEVEI